jgi:hypothetical protein
MNLMGKKLALLLIMPLVLASVAGFVFLSGTITSRERLIAEGQRQLEQGQPALAAGEAKLAAGKQKLSEGRGRHGVV